MRNFQRPVNVSYRAGLCGLEGRISQKGIGQNDVQMVTGRRQVD